MKHLTASFAMMPAALFGAVPSIHASTVPPTPPAIVAPEQVAAQKQAVQQALDRVKTAQEAMKATLATLGVDRGAAQAARKSGDKAQVEAFKQKLAQSKEAIKTARQPLEDALKAFHQELLKLPPADRRAFRDQMRAMKDGPKEMGRGHRGDRGEAHGDAGNGLRAEWHAKLKSLRHGAK